MRTGFNFDVGEWRELTARAGLQPADQAALIRLLCSAWSSPDCALPREHLYTASGLGAGWESSRLAAEIGRWFDPLPDGRLQARSLAREREHGRRVSAGRSAAGAKGAAARWQMPSGKVHGKCHGGTDGKCHAESPMANAMQEPEAGGRTARNPDAQTCLRATAASAGPESFRPPSPPPAELSKCTGAEETAAIVGVCGEATLAALSEARDRGACPPPHPPYREESLAQEGNGGCGGKGRPEVRADLFGVHRPRRQRALRRRPTGVQQEAACRVVDAYTAQVAPDTRRTLQADRNAAWWLAGGVTEEQLLLAVRNYAAHCTKVQRDPKFRKGAAGFFGRMDPVWRGYLEEEAKPRPRRRYTPPDDAPPAPAGEWRRRVEAFRAKAQAQGVQT